MKTKLIALFSLALLANIFSPLRSEAAIVSVLGDFFSVNQKALGPLEWIAGLSIVAGGAELIAHGGAGNCPGGESPCGMVNGPTSFVNFAIIGGFVLLDQKEPFSVHFGALSDTDAQSLQITPLEKEKFNAQLETTNLVWETISAQLQAYSVDHSQQQVHEYETQVLAPQEIQPALDSNTYSALMKISRSIGEQLSQDSRPVNP